MPRTTRRILRQFPNGRFAELARGRAAPAEPSPTEPARQQQAMLLPPLHTTPEPAAPASPESSRTLSLFAASARALNVVSADFQRSYDAYRRQFDPERGPTGKEQSIQGLSAPDSQTLSALQDLKRALAQGAAGGPSAVSYMELREAVALAPEPAATWSGAESLGVLARRYAEAADTLLAALGAARIYYDPVQQGYKDDNFSRGRAMHPGLIAAFRQFAAASDAMLLTVRSAAAAARNSYLTSLQASDSLQYEMLRGIAQARRLVGFVRAASSGANARRIDVAGLQAEIDQARRGFAGVQQLLRADPDLAKREFGIDGDEHLSGYTEGFTGMLQASGTLLQQRGLPTGYGAQMWSLLVFNFNKMVDSENYILYYRPH